jgi:uncharacterized protein (TIGR02246 family)
MNADEKAAAATLEAYAAALNASDTETIVKLYAADGVFMPQHFPSSVGSDAIRQAYTGIFGAIRLDVEFTIAECVQAGPRYCFARTNSAGQTTEIATGRKSAEGNQELFVLQKVGAEWKIARYCFCTTNPPK